MMIDFLRNLLSPPPDRRADVEAPVAVAALLSEAAHADGVTDAVEAATVEKHLGRLFGLAPSAAAALRAKGEAARRDAADVFRFTLAIKTALDEAERAALMEALWAVALADGARDPHEDALLRKLAPLIAVSDRDSVAARRRAMQEN
jgi:uncharacterized tellurite resistance protein B-like protein